MPAYPISREILVTDFWTKMFSANEIAVFFNQQYLKNELTDYPNDLTVSRRARGERPPLPFFEN